MADASCQLRHHVVQHADTANPVSQARAAGGPGMLLMNWKRKAVWSDGRLSYALSESQMLNSGFPRTESESIYPDLNTAQEDIAVSTAPTGSET